MNYLGCPWKSQPPATLRLKNSEVHVWLAPLNLPSPSVEAFRQTLSADECSRAERFYLQEHREHFVVARGRLRLILGRYLDKSPLHLRFCYNSYGKPALSRSDGGESFKFSLSHSHGLALYAVTRDQEIGVDIERIRSGPSDKGIAERFFSLREVAILRDLPGEMQDEAFFNCWTRKEAYIKAKGRGLSIPLSQFDVSLAQGDPPALLRTQWDKREPSRWTIQALTPYPGYAAAVAVEGVQLKFFCWQWPE